MLSFGVIDRMIEARESVRGLYRMATGIAALVTLPLRRTDGALAVYYGGARAGDVGGTLAKVRMLRARFPDHQTGYSLVYMLSNAIYLPPFALSKIKRVGVPIVLNQNGVFYPGWYPEGWERENARMAKVHAVADHVFYQSEFCRRSAERFLGARNGSSEILYNGVDVSRFVPFAGERKSGSFVFLATGKFGASTEYRLTASIAGIAAARGRGLDVRLVIAGYMEPSVALRVRAKVAQESLGDVVTFTGAYDAAAAPEIYRSADAYLMLKHNDPCPNSVLEAMASGLPVLYSNSGGVPELVGSEAGHALAVEETFEKDVAPDPLAIADGMSVVMTQKQSMGKAARARAMASFDLEKWLDRHAAVFIGALQRNRGT